jgi:uncharacterized protein with beta-barrel porin domain
MLSVLRSTLAITLACCSLASFAAAPIAGNDVRVITANSSVTINALNNDSDPDGDSIAITAIVQPEVGTAQLRNPDGAVIYTPPVGFVGRVQINYTLTDLPQADVNPQNTTGTIVITVVAFNPNPEQENQASVGNALTSACDRLGSADPDTLSAGQRALAARCQGLLQLQVANPGALAEVIRQITPEETLALMKAAAGASTTHSQALSGHLSSLGQGIHNLSLNGLSWQDAAHTGGAAGDSLSQSPWGLFGTLQLESAEKDRTRRENGFDYSANTLVAGVDYRWSESWALGLAGGYTQNDLEYREQDGEVSAKITSLMAFSLFNWGNFSWDLQAGISQSDYDISRRIRYTDFSPLAFNTQGTTSGQHLFANTQLQYAFTRGALSLYPSLKLSYNDNQVDAYGENNAGGFEVNLAEQTSDQLNLTAGLASQYAVSGNWGVWVPTASFNWVQQVAGDKTPVAGDFAFSGAGNARFVLTPEETDESFYQLGLGSSWVFPNGWSGFINWQQVMAVEDFSAQQLEMGFRLEL